MFTKSSNQKKIAKYIRKYILEIWKNGNSCLIDYIPRKKSDYIGTVGSSVSFDFKPGYKRCDLLKIQVISLIEITAIRLKRIFQPMRAFGAGHGVYKPAYN